MKSRNYRVTVDSVESAKRLAEEYRYIGREVDIDGTTVVVLALPRQKPKKKADDDRRKATGRDQASKKDRR